MLQPLNCTRLRTSNIGQYQIFKMQRGEDKIARSVEEGMQKSLCDNLYHTRILEPDCKHTKALQLAGLWERSYGLPNSKVCHDLFGASQDCPELVSSLELLDDSTHTSSCQPM